MKYVNVIFTDRPIKKNAKTFKNYAYNNSIEVEEGDLVVAETVYGYAIVQVVGFTDTRPNVETMRDLVIKIPVKETEDVQDS